MHKDIFVGEKLIAQVYSINDATQTQFPTPPEMTFQFGVGVNSEDKTYKTHIHKNATREIETTSEFLYVVNGQMDVDILNEDESLVEKISLTDNMALLQFFGGHAIRTKAGTKYFELKQGPYQGRDFDKYDVEDGT
jgi:hypothetical protein